MNTGSTKILAIDPARSGAWAVFDYDRKKLLSYGTFDFDSRDFTYARATVEIDRLILSVVQSHNVNAVFIEDIQLRKNVASFKKLAMLQGVLVASFERNEYLYDYIAPSKWQAYCNARGRTSVEIKARKKQAENKKQSKLLSLEFVREEFGIDTENDNLSDAICIGWYVCNNIPIDTGRSE